MDYFPLGDLSRYIQTRIPESEIREITRQLLNGLASMHSIGYTHRDLKPGNIFVAEAAPAWKVKIGDFGISKRVVGEDTELRSFVGTRTYMAPEIVLGGLVNDETTPSYTNAVDIWALGCVVYQLFALQPAFSTDNELFRYAKGKVDFPEAALSANSASTEGIKFVKTMLRPTAQDRPSAESALAFAWIRSLNSGTASLALRAATLSTTHTRPAPSLAINATVTPNSSFQPKPVSDLDGFDSATVVPRNHLRRVTDRANTRQANKQREAEQTFLADKRVMEASHRSPPLDNPRLRETDFSYITADDLRRHQARSINQQQSSQDAPTYFGPDRDTDVLCFDNKEQLLYFVVHFPAYSILNGELTVGQVREQVAMKTTTSDPKRIKLLFKGKDLKNDTTTCKAEGLRDGSELLITLAQRVESASDSDDDDYEFGDEPTMLIESRSDGGKKFSELPEGWSEHFDNKARRSYYYNKLTRTSQWEPPDDMSIKLQKPSTPVPTSHKQDSSSSRARPLQFSRAAAIIGSNDASASTRQIITRTVPQSQSAVSRSVPWSSEPRLFANQGDFVSDICFSQDGQMLVIGEGWARGLGKYPVRIWDMTGRVIGHYSHDYSITSITTSPSGLIASGSHDVTVRVWDTKTQREVHKWEHGSGVTCVDFSLRGETLVSATWNDGIALRDMVTGQEIGVPGLGSGMCDRQAAFSPDGRSIAFDTFFDTSGHVRIWDLRSQREAMSFPGRSGDCSKLSFSPDGSMLATAWKRGDGCMDIWNIAGGTKLQSISNKSCLDAAFSPDGKTLAYLEGMVSEEVKLWDVRRGKGETTLRSGADAGQDHLTQLAFKPVGRTLAVGTEKGKILVWDG